MIHYIYDGSFEGILTAIYHAYYNKEIPEQILSQDDLQESLMVRKVYIETDMEKADKVYHSVETKISKQAMKNIFYVYLSEERDRGTMIYQYLKLGWKMGKSIDGNLKNNHVLVVQNMYKKVSKEIHLMLGLVRFKELKNDLLYAAIEPDYNIVFALADHFAERISNERWIIHDIRRNIAVVYNKEEWLLTELKLKGDIELHKEEESYQKLWKQYFKSISIENKVNPRLQKGYMPVRYWKHLIEK
ncbi:TIGR03915 family putative DNA repair protein [Alkaliphilus oremlandii]|uniref:DUF4130 domain-containing protein n=1 Tax=Alkaliphilus oremlandii (strain OhILAs) TaxID=350688 RepID=A8MM34_ALKOO|nr:TIGR03915 family putative DNA repair protein [Alkaliphilus oremlandii]ABW18201.1 conserved hypothetical protein [Alkaliphilus oremlandii OhILAs]